MSATADARHATRRLWLRELAGNPRPVEAEPAFARGADATIHRVNGRPDLTLKLYHDSAKDPSRRAKLEAMLAAPPDLSNALREQPDVALFGWPCALVLDEGGELLGYAMPSLPLEHASPLEYLLTARARRAYRLHEHYGFRVAAARNLAGILAAVHAQGHHVIDLKPVNCSVYHGSFMVALLDCDGFSIAAPGGRHFPAHQFSDGYIAPEAIHGGLRPEQLGEAQDRFALAVILFQLLNNGLHPFQGVPADRAAAALTNQERIAAGLYAYGLRPHPRQRPAPASLHEHWPPATRELFERAFAGDAAARPSAAEWQQHGRHLLQDLRRCRRQPQRHAHFGRACGHCVVEAAQARGQQEAAERAKQPPSPPKPAPARAPRVGAARRSRPSPASVAAGMGVGLVIALVFVGFVYWLGSKPRVWMAAVEPASGVIPGYVGATPRAAEPGTWTLIRYELFEGDLPIAGSASIVNDEFRFKPARPLRPEQAYRVALEAVFTNDGGRQARLEHEWTFGIAHDAVPDNRSTRIVPPEVLPRAERFGYTLDVSGDGRSVLVGAPRRYGYRPEDSGSLYLYRHIAGLWLPQARLQISPRAAGSLGYRSAIDDGGRVVAALVCGDPQYGETCLELHVFNESDGRWYGERLREASPGDPVAPLQAVALSGDGRTLVVVDTLQVDVYRREQQTWHRWQSLRLPPDLAASLVLADAALSHDGGLLVVGVPTAGPPGSDEGAVMLYRRGGDGRYAEPEIFSRHAGGDHFGLEVALSRDGDVLAVSGVRPDGKTVGAIYLYALAANGSPADEQIIRDPAPLQPPQFSPVERKSRDDFVFHRRFSLSADGRRLVTGFRALHKPREGHSSAFDWPNGYGIGIYDRIGSRWQSGAWIAPEYLKHGLRRPDRAFGQLVLDGSQFMIGVSSEMASTDEGPPPDSDGSLRYLDLPPNVFGAASPAAGSAP